MSLTWVNQCATRARQYNRQAHYWQQLLIRLLRDTSQGLSKCRLTEALYLYHACHAQDRDPIQSLFDQTFYLALEADQHFTYWYDVWWDDLCRWQYQQGRRPNRGHTLTYQDNWLGVSDLVRNRLRDTWPMQTCDYQPCYNWTELQGLLTPPEVWRQQPEEAQLENPEWATKPTNRRPTRIPIRPGFRAGWRSREHSCPT